MERSTFCECIPKKEIVKYSGSKYLPINYQLGFDFKSKDWIHSAVLLDLKNNKTVVIAPLSKIERIEK